MHSCSASSTFYSLPKTVSIALALMVTRDGHILKSPGGVELASSLRPESWLTTHSDKPRVAEISAPTHDQNGILPRRFRQARSCNHRGTSRSLTTEQRHHHLAPRNGSREILHPTTAVPNSCTPLATSGDSSIILDTLPTAAGLWTRRNTTPHQRWTSATCDYHRA